MPAPQLFTLLALFLFLAAGSALFSAIETALFSLQEYQIRRLRERHPIAGGTLQRLLANPRRLLSTILLADALLSVPLMLLCLYLLDHFTPALHLAWKILITCAVVAGACDLVPKLIALRRPSRISRHGVVVLRLIRPLLEPLSLQLQRLCEFIAAALTPKSFQAPPAPVEDELNLLVRLSEEEGALRPAESEIIQEIIKLGDKLVRNCMTPRIEVFAIADDLTNEEAIRQLREKRFRRVLIYGDTPDDVLGVLDVKALLLNPGVPYTEVMSPPSFIPETMKALDLLRSFLKHPQGLAVILDEFGGTEGVITLSDLVEEIISDAVPDGEHQLYLEDLGGGRWLASGATILADLREHGIRFDAEGIHTLGGLIFTRLGAMPKPGAELTLDGVRLTVRRTTRKKIAEVLINTAFDVDEPPAEVAR